MKRLHVLSFALSAAVLVAPFAGVIAPAQAEPRLAPVTQQNLIANGGFESGTAAWDNWWFEIPKPTDGSFNYAYRPSHNVEQISNGAAAPLIHSGNASFRVINNWDPWQGGVRQQVTAAAGSRIRLTAWGFMWAASDNWPTPTDTTVGGVMRVGIDPAGTAYPTSASNVTWSGYIAPHGTWQSVSVEATVGSTGKAMIILSGSYMGFSRLWMATFWDDVTVEVIGAGTNPTTAPGATSGPQPTARPVATRAPYVPPTPDANGNLIYVVQDGDTLWGISFTTGKSLEDIRNFNGGLAGDLIFVGQRLIIGKATPPATDTPPPAPTSDPNQPTAAPQNTPSTGTDGGPVITDPTATIMPQGQLCVLIYEDANGNASRDADEGIVNGGTLTVVDATTGAPIATSPIAANDTDPNATASEYFCSNYLPGRYVVSVAAPTGYNPTTNPNAELDITLQRADVAFGAQRSANAGTTNPGGTGTTPGDTGAGNNRLQTALFGAAGIMLLLAAAGVAGFLMLRRR